MSDERAVVVLPRHPAHSTIGTWFVRLSLPWLLGSLLLIDGVLAWAGLPSGERPLTTRIGIVAIAVAPVVIVLARSHLVGLAAFQWLFRQPQPLAVVRPDGLDLRTLDLGSRSLAWDEIGSLRVVGSWDGGAELRSPSGDLIATVPDVLVHPRVNWRTAHTFAETVIRMRPDRYALAPERASLGRPASFDLQEVVGSGIDPGAWQRRRSRATLVVAAILLLLGAVPLVLLVTR
jgi:hypothetical protein